MTLPLKQKKNRTQEWKYYSGSQNNKFAPLVLFTVAKNNSKPLDSCWARNFHVFTQGQEELKFPNPKNKKTNRPMQM